MRCPMCWTRLDLWLQKRCEGDCPEGGQKPSFNRSYTYKQPSQILGFSSEIVVSMHDNHFLGVPLILYFYFSKGGGGIGSSDFGSFGNNIG